MQNDLVEINQKLVEILSPERGYFGRIYTFGLRPTAYEYIGYVLTKDFSLALQGMPEDQRKNLCTIMNYFEIHALPLKNLLIVGEKEQFYGLYYEIAWSHFMIVVMFGMIEAAVKIQKGAKLNKYGGLDNKVIQIKDFLENNLEKKVKENIAKRYCVDEIFNHKEEIKSFSDVIDHLWVQIRSGFIHDAGIESKGLEWHKIEGYGTKNNPLTLKSDVPVQELLQITWQAILKSCGYNGVLELPKHKKR